MRKPPFADVDNLFDLTSILNESEFVALTEALGGTRIYLPMNIKPKSPVVKAIGDEATKKLTSVLGYGALRIPMAREFRARYYRKQGKTISQIARLLGITEGGVSRLLKRVAG